jgi:hypothetical protein
LPSPGREPNITQHPESTSAFSELGFYGRFFGAGSISAAEVAGGYPSSSPFSPGSTALYPAPHGSTRVETRRSLISLAPSPDFEPEDRALEFLRRALASGERIQRDIRRLASEVHTDDVPTSLRMQSV